MSTNRRRGAKILLLVCLALTAHLYFAADNSNCSDTQAPTYPEASESNNAFIPFVNAPFPILTYSPAFDLSITTEWNKPKYIGRAAMDTGSTGVMIGGGLLGFSDATKFEKSRPGSEYLSSSGRLWTGYWIDADVTFYLAERDEQGQRQQVVSHIPILAVNESSTCLAYGKLGYCPEEEKQNVVKWPNSTHYLGVGFGRGSVQQPQASPDKNPFVNVGKIRGSEVKDIHQGYIITQNGIHVGLTKDLAAQFRKTKLDVRAGSKAPDWAMANMATRINGSPYNHGKALFDTGINRSYVTVHQDIQSKTKTEPSRLIKNNPKVLVPGSVVEVLVPDEKNPIANYTVTVTGDPQGMEPLGYVMKDPPSPSSTTGLFINTGRMFYDGFDAMLDSECGWFGLRNRQEPMT
ncbi:adhesin aida-i [Colletotrichum truncatum]|uniref:Adhesin aida-i n=1 Tax=Colletotrichum truncatum TaxID=5467 RepID=A0ACC3YP91_COLTU|nr:adhesin aida-i [Colletotrichum truncatum]KAF6782801.1 adhesin aida-i [Colletotrichum truncatum]